MPRSYNWRPFTPEEDARIVALRTSGLSVPKISAAVGRACSSIYSRLRLLAYREEFGPHRRPFTTKDEKIIREMLAVGATSAQIAIAIDRSPEGVRGRIAKMRKAACSKTSA